MSTLYIIATPIGNLEDITLRALRVLKEVDRVFCEDTRTTRVLLQKYDIHTPTESYHVRSNDTKTERILDLLAVGKDLALVSDAGTPGISDPGFQLILAARKRFATHQTHQIGDALGDMPKLSIVPIPGACAFVSALSVSGLPTAEFTFLGFLPHKKGRQTLFAQIAASEITTVFYESPHRILKTLESLSGALADGRPIVIARELTKIFEEVTFFDAKRALEYFTSHPDKVRGEFTVIVSPLSFL